MRVPWQSWARLLLRRGPPFLGRTRASCERPRRRSSVPPQRGGSVRRTGPRPAHSEESAEPRRKPPAGPDCRHCGWPRGKALPGPRSGSVPHRGVRPPPCPRTLGARLARNGSRRVCAAQLSRLHSWRSFRLPCSPALQSQPLESTSIVACGPPLESGSYTSPSRVSDQKWGCPFVCAHKHSGDRPSGWWFRGAQARQPRGDQLGAKCGMGDRGSGVEGRALVASGVAFRTGRRRRGADHDHAGG